MQALVELYDADNLARVLDSGARLIGINNRDLRTFVTRLGRFGLGYGCGFGRHFFSWTLRQTGLPAGFGRDSTARRGRGVGGPAKLPFYYMGHKFKYR